MVNYSREVLEVTCNKCGKKAEDVKVEKVHFEEVSKNSFKTWITMDCDCGGQYKYGNNIIW